MPQGPAAGVMFMGGLMPKDRELYYPILKGLRRQGYNRFIEPACGAFAFSHVAAQTGWQPHEIEASDITLFSSVMGAAIMGERVDHLEIAVDDFEDDDLGDPATVLWVQAYLRAKGRGDKNQNPYWQAVYRQMELDRGDQIEKLREDLAKAHDRLNGLSYRPLDLFDHLEEVADDPKAVVGLMAPWVSKDFEKFFDPDGLFRWKSPAYSVFEPDEGFRRIFEIFREAKCLILMATTSKFWDGDPPAFAIYGSTAKDADDKRGVRSINTVFLSNRHETVTDLLGGTLAVPYKATGIEVPPWPFLPGDYELTRKTKVKVVRVTPQVAMYCRHLWTHQFVGAPSIFNLALFLDDYLVGVFGMHTGTRGGAAGDSASYIEYMYGMAVQHRRDFRFPLLLAFTGMSRQVVDLCFPAYTAATATTVTTVDMGNRRFMKGYRSRMVVKGVDLKATVTKQTKDPYGGFAMHYYYPIVDASPRDIYLAWLERDLRWRKNREKNERIRRQREAEKLAAVQTSNS